MTSGSVTLKTSRAMRRAKLWREIKRHRVMYLFLVPALITVAVFAYTPMAGLIMGFQDYDIVKSFSGSRFVGLKHFQRFLGDKDFYRALVNTLGMNGYHILFGFPLPIALAIMIFSMRDSAYKRITQTISYLPHFISWVVVAGLVKKMLDAETGFVNTQFTNMGLDKVAFMHEPNMFWAITVISAIWKELGWNTIIYLAALSGIDAEQYESAIVDGANGRQKLLFITLPGLMPTIGLMLIFTIGQLISDGGISFDAVFNLRNPFLASKANTLSYFIFSEGVLSNKLSYATAIGFAQGLVSLILVLSANAASRRIRGYGAF